MSPSAPRLTAGISESGTRAIVYQEGDHIALRPVTPKYIRSLRGSLKGTKAMEVFLAERKREREL